MLQHSIVPIHNAGFLAFVPPTARDIKLQESCTKSAFVSHSVSVNCVAQNPAAFTFYPSGQLTQVCNIQEQRRCLGCSVWRDYCTSLYNHRKKTHLREPPRAVAEVGETAPSSSGQSVPSCSQTASTHCKLFSSLVKRSVARSY